MNKRSYDFYGFASAFIVLSAVIALWAGSQVRSGEPKPTQNAPLTSVSTEGSAGAEAHGQSTSAQPDVTSQGASSQPQTMGETNLQQKTELAPQSTLPRSAPNTNRAPSLLPTKIVWETNYEAAVQHARAEGKPLMVDFYTDWCSACKQLDAEVYSRSNIVASTQNFVCVKINAEKRTDLAGAYGVKGYPTIAFVRANPQGNMLLGKLPGAVDAQSFAQVLDTAQTQYQQAGSARPAPESA